MKIMKDYVTRDERLESFCQNAKPWWSGLFKENARLMCLAVMLVFVVFTLFEYR